MLMINTDVQAFVMQNTIAQGSADIQILINAQRQLSYVKSVHPAIDSLYLYSKKSDYLLEADNAFFDIDAMYSSLFEFKDLSKNIDVIFVKDVIKQISDKLKNELSAKID